MIKILYRVLIGAALTLFLGILSVTLYVYFDRGYLFPPASSSAVSPPDEAIFTGVGRLRGESSDGASVAAAVGFSYPRDDRAFTEELAARTGDMRAAALDFFRSRSAAELRGLDEEKLKKELLSRFNKLLRLGQIRELYLSDFLVLD